MSGQIKKENLKVNQGKYTKITILGLLDTTNFMIELNSKISSLKEEIFDRSGMKDMVIYWKGLCTHHLPIYSFLPKTYLSMHSFHAVLFIDKLLQIKKANVSILKSTATWPLSWLMETGTFSSICHESEPKTTLHLNRNMLSLRVKTNFIKTGRTLTFF